MPGGYCAGSAHLLSSAWAGDDHLALPSGGLNAVSSWLQLCTLVKCLQCWQAHKPPVGSGSLPCLQVTPLQL